MPSDLDLKRKVLRAALGAKKLPHGWVFVKRESHHNAPWWFERNGDEKISENLLFFDADANFMVPWSPQGPLDKAIEHHDAVSALLKFIRKQDLEKELVIKTSGSEVALDLSEEWFVWKLAGSAGPFMESSAFAKAHKKEWTALFPIREKLGIRAYRLTISL